MELVRVRLDDPLARPLLDGLEAEYEARYGENDEMTRTEAHEFDPPRGLFVVLLDGRVTAAGGGYRYHEERVCEVKRMWTDPRYRRQGLGRRVLDALESAAAAAGYRRLLLETGFMQPEAAALYEARGYTPIPPYGPYTGALAFETALPAPRREVPQ